MRCAPFGPPVQQVRAGASMRFAQAPETDGWLSTDYLARIDADGSDRSVSRSRAEPTDSCRCRRTLFRAEEDEMSIEGRVAIVTGAGGGLGRQHALYLARKGARVVVNDLAQSAADEVAAEIKGAGGEAIAVAASVTDEGAVGAMIERAKSQWGRIDILVNNAGILRDKSFAKMSLDDFRAVVDVHLMGAVICTKPVWDIMREQRHGRIVMTTSSSGLWGNFGQANYGAAKMALVG